MKFNHAINNFSSGELSPYLLGRTDLEEYYRGLAEMTNFVPIKQGGAAFRPGTVFEGLEDGDSVIFPLNPEDGKNFMISVSPFSGIKIKDMAGGASTLVLPTSNNVFNKHIDFNSMDGILQPFADDSQAAIRIRNNLMFTSNGDVFVIIDGTGIVAPIVGKRVAENKFVIDSLLYPSVINPDTNVLWIDTTVKYPLRVPYRDPNINDDIRMNPSGTSGTITITSQDAAGAPINYFTGDPVGMYIKITHGSTTGVAIVREKISDSQVSAQIWNIPFGGSTATSNWEVSSWNAKDGYPRSACFYEGRLYFGGNNTFPDTMWASLVGNIYHFMARRFIQDLSTDTTKLNYFGTVKETDPFNFTIAATTANSIQWIHPSDTLIVGTTSNEYSISGGPDSIISIASINVNAISSHGSAKVEPVKVGSSILFVSLDGKRLLEIPKRLQEYISATEMTSLSEGIIDKAFDLVEPTLNFYNNFQMRQLAYQENEGIVWVLLRDRVYGFTGLLSLSIDRTSKTLGWAKHTMSNARIKSIAVAADPNRGNYSFLYMINERNSEHTLEKLWFRTRYPKMNQTNSFATLGADKSVNHLDAATFVNAPLSGNSVSMPVHLRGEVAVMTPEGEYLGKFTVSSGSISIPDAHTYSKFIVGYLFKGELKTMPLEAGAQFGVSQGSMRRSHEIALFLDRSRGGTYQASNAKGEFDILKSSLASAASLYTGEVRLPLNASPDDYQLFIRQDKPFPMTVLWLLKKGYTHDS